MDFAELNRLWNLGFALHWLRPRSKVPLRGKWTQGARLDWPEFKKQYREGLNVGVRLGEASKVDGGYLAVIDLDVKSTDPKHQAKARNKLAELFPEVIHAPKVLSGRGNGSAHYYVKLKAPSTGGETLARARATVPVEMPSVSPSQKEKHKLSQKKLEEGFRLRPAWEISLLSHGRQVVLPPSIHPDSGNEYVWARRFKDKCQNVPLIDRPEPPVASSPPVNSSSMAAGETTPPFFAPVEIGDLHLKPQHAEMLTTGEGVSDRSAAIFSVCLALVAKNIPDEVILSALTDPKFWLAQTGYDHAKTKDRARAALWVQRYCLVKAKAKIEEEHAAPRDVFEVAEEWQKKLTLTQGPKGAPLKIKATFGNALLILRNVVGEGLLKRNLFASCDFWGLDTPWGASEGQKRSGSNEDALEVKEWILGAYSVDFPTQIIEEALTWITLQNEFHPVKDFLEPLTWDGVSRVENAFMTYLTCNDMPAEYMWAVSRKFFLALIARIYDPGCKLDSMIVLEGKQGIGKSSFGRILVGDEWFMDSLPDLADKDAALSLQGIWLCEMSELSSLYRSAVESTKAFISRQVDKVRPPYGRRRIDLPRSTVFFGTTNDMDFLIDPTGNRRFWPLQAHQLNFKALIRDRKQLLAEAKFLYDFAGEPLYLTGKIKKIAEGIQADKRVDDDGDAMLGMLHEYKGDVTQRRFRVDELFDSGPWVSFPKNMTTRKAAGRVLRDAGFIRVHTEYGKRWSKK